MVTPVRRLATLVVLGLVAAACSTPTLGGSPDPATTLRQAGQALTGLKTVSADARFGDGIVYQGMTLTSATTRVRLPSDSETDIKLKQGDFLVEVRLITIGNRAWLRLPLSRYSELTPDQSAALPNISRIFNAHSGLPALLAGGGSPRAQGSETVGGVNCQKVAASYTSAEVGRLLGPTPSGGVRVTLWVGNDDHLLRRVWLTGPLLEAGSATTVRIDLRDFNRPVDIQQPAP